jgi:hypothetical protein
MRVSYSLLKNIVSYILAEAMHVVHAKWFLKSYVPFEILEGQISLMKCVHKKIMSLLQFHFSCPCSCKDSGLSAFYAFNMAREIFKNLTSSNGNKTMCMLTFRVSNAKSLIALTAVAGCCKVYSPLKLILPIILYF